MTRKKVLTVAISIMCSYIIVEAQARRNSRPEPCPDTHHAVRVMPKVLKDKATNTADIHPPKDCRCEGRVVVHVLVAEDGAVECAKYKEGHPLLRKAALEAVKRWKFKPLKLSGVPVKYHGDLELDIPEQAGKEGGVRQSRQPEPRERASYRSFDVMCAARPSQPLIVTA